MKPDKASVLIKRGALECERIAIPVLGWYDLTMAQFKILKYLYYRADDRVRLMDVEEYFSMTHPSASGIVQNLEKAGFVTREPDPDHPRVRYLRLTEKALALQPELNRAGDSIEEELTKNLTAEERDRLIRLLAKMQGLETPEADTEKQPLTELPPMERAEGEELQKLRERVHWFETNDAARYEGAEPLNAESVYRELLADYDNAHARYYEKRIRLTGLVSKLGPDSFGAPSFEFTDAENSRCYALVVFPDKDIYDRVKDGDAAEIIGNVVFIREPYGLVVKKCELLKVN